MMERVEVAFIKHFSNANRSKGMNILRPKKKRDKHRITFSMGKTFYFLGNPHTSGVKVKQNSLTMEVVILIYFVGFAFGCSVALLVALVLIIRAQNILEKPGREAYMNTLFPLYR